MTEAEGALMAEAAERTRNKATVRILRVLSAFIADKPVFGVTELSQRLGMSMNMVHRALSTLVEQGYLVRSARGTGYELGYRVIELQNPAQPEPDFRSLGAPFMRQLFELVGEAASLVQLAGDAVLVVDGIASTAPGSHRIRLGLMLPLHVSPGARAVLSSLPDELIEGYLERNSPLVAYTGTTITDPEKLWEDVRRVRERGYAWGYGDSTARTISIAFPVIGADQMPSGAMTVGGPEDRLTRAMLESKVERLRAVADDLNRLSRLYFFGTVTPPKAAA